MAVLGGGVVSAVYVVDDLARGRRAALKMLRLPHARTPDLVQRFFAEARAAAARRGAGIVDVHDVGYTEDGLAYLVMELLDGETLADRLGRERRLAVAPAIRITRAVAVALSSIHEHGILHRELRPQHVFLVRDLALDAAPGAAPTIKLLDVGLAGLVGDHAAGGGRGRGNGAAPYAAPEQGQDLGATDARTDLYALGCVCFEMITGRPPFVADSPFELIAAHRATPPPDLREHADEVPAELAAIVDRLLAKDPAHRFPSAAELIAALDAVTERHDASRRSDALSARRSTAPSPRRWQWLHQRWLHVVAALVGGVLAGVAVATIW